MHLSIPRNFDYLTAPNVPVEQNTSIVFGTFLHLGPPIFFVLSVLLTGFSLPHNLIAYISITVVFLIFNLAAEAKNPCVDLGKPTTFDIKEGVSFIFFKGLILGGLTVVTIWHLLAIISPYQTLSSSWILIALAVLLTDLSYYLTHRFLNHGKGSTPILKWYKKIHAVHHSVSKLDFLRGNVSTAFDTAVTGFQVPLAIIAFLLGMDFTSTIIAYGLVLMLQSTHHVNYTFNIGVFRYFFMDNHAHKLHHCKRGGKVNLGALFSIWDRLFGTYYEDWKISANYLHANGIALPIKRNN